MGGLKLRRLFIVLTIFCASCATSGYHYESGSFYLVSNDPCQWPIVTSAKAIDKINETIGTKNGVPKPVVKIKDPTSLGPINENSIYNGDVGQDVKCNVKLVYKDGSSQKGVLYFVYINAGIFPFLARIEDPWPALNPQPVSWESQDEIDEKNAIAAKQSYLINSYARKEDDASSIHIPLHCKSKQAVQDEMSAIPNVLGVPQNIYIVNIEPLADMNRLKYWSNIPPRSHYFLSCVLKVKWNNGNIDMGYWYTIWRDPNGQVMNYYGQKEFIPGE